MGQKKIAMIVGSLRKESFNRKMAMNFMRMAPAALKMEIVEIRQLSFYNQDFDENSPADWVNFRESIKKYDGILFFTPEYNRSVPGVLKNAIDIGSRPYGKSVWNGKPAGVISVSPGSIGGFGANHHLRQSLVALNMPTMQQPEAYIGGAARLFGDQGELINEATQEFAKKFIAHFAEWVERVTARPAST